MAPSVFAALSTQTHLREVVEVLIRVGFRSADISLAVPVSTGQSPESTPTAPPSPAGHELAGVRIVQVPRLGELIAAGPILADLGGGTADQQGLGALGLPADQVERLERHLQEGRILIAVAVENREWDERARAVLIGQGGMEVVSSAPSAAPVELPGTQGAL